MSQFIPNFRGPCEKAGINDGGEQHIKRTIQKLGIALGSEGNKAVVEFLVEPFFKFQPSYEFCDKSYYWDFLEMHFCYVNLSTERGGVSKHPRRSAQ